MKISENVALASCMDLAGMISQNEATTFGFLGVPFVCDQTHRLNKRATVMRKKILATTF